MAELGAPPLVEVRFPRPEHNLEQTQELLDRTDQLFDEAEKLQKQARAALANHSGAHRKDQPSAPEKGHDKD